MLIWPRVNHWNMLEAREDILSWPMDSWATVNSYIFRLMKSGIVCYRANIRDTTTQVEKMLFNRYLHESHIFLTHLLWISLAMIIYTFPYCIQKTYFADFYVSSSLWITQYSSVLCFYHCYKKINCIWLLQIIEILLQIFTIILKIKCPGQCPAL